VEIFIGLWRAKPAWLALGRAARVAYMAGLAASVSGVIKGGAEVLAWGTVDNPAPQVPFDFYAVWRFRDAEGALAYENQLAAHRWGDYFDYVAVHGAARTPLDVLTRSINL
jgi:hypothetical protein